MDLNNLILFFILTVFGLFFYKYFLLIVNKHYPKLLIDDQLGKPQAFHKDPVPRSGGLAGSISLLIFFSLYYVIFEKLFSNYIFLSLIIFFLGFSEDLKFKIKPKYKTFIYTAPNIYKSYIYIWLFRLRRKYFPIYYI